jgi:hypothetical protein
MKSIRLGRPLLALIGLALLVVLGCGPGKGTVVSGKVVLPSGVTFEKDDQVAVTFTPDDPKLKRGAAGSGQASGKVSEVTFTANTSETTGVLPGKYKIMVKITPYAGFPGSETRKKQLDDAFNKKYDTTTTLSYEVTAGAANNITIDLGKGTVTKN